MIIDIEAQAFVASVFLSASEGRDQITVEDAERTIACWREEGIDVPASLTAEIFAKLWNWWL